MHFNDPLKLSVLTLLNEMVRASSIYLSPPIRTVYVMQRQEFAMLSAIFIIEERLKINLTPMDMRSKVQRNFWKHTYITYLY